MININILFPNEKRRIIKQISKIIQWKYHKTVNKYDFLHVGDEKVYLYIYLTDGTRLHVTAEIGRITNTLTITPL